MYLRSSSTCPYNFCPYQQISQPIASRAPQLRVNNFNLFNLSTVWKGGGKPPLKRNDFNELSPIWNDPSPFFLLCKGLCLTRVLLESKFDGFLPLRLRISGLKGCYWLLASQVSRFLFVILQFQRQKRHARGKRGVSRLRPSETRILPCSASLS